MNSKNHTPQLPQVARKLLWMAAGLLTGSGLLLALALGYLRDQAHLATQSSIASMVRIVQEQTDRTLQSVDLRLQLAANQLTQLRAHGALDRPAAEAMLRAHVQEMPFVRAMWVMDTQGVIVYDSDSRYAGTDLADRAYFQIYRQHPDTGFYLGNPVKSRVNAKWVISATRPLRGSDNAFAGVVVASLEPDYFDKLWSTLDLGANGSLSLFRRDAVLLMRSPMGDDTIGKPASNLPLFSALDLGRRDGLFEDNNPLEPSVHDYAYRSLVHYPAVVVVGKTHEATFTPWTRMGMVAIVAWGAACLCVLLLLLALVRDLARREAVEQDLRESKIKQLAMLDALPDLMFEVGADGRYYDYHSPRNELLATTPTEFLGKTADQVLPPEAAATVMAAVREALAGGHCNGYQICLQLPQGEHWFELSASRKELLRGEGPRCIILSRDITQRKHDALSLQRALSEKVGLLNEVHHRVKNNLQVIASLLRLEANRSVQVETKSVLGEMQGRIRSMALLHESLYRTGTFASVELGTYLKRLCLQAFRSGTQQTDGVRLVTDLAEVQVTMDQATPCGLLVNELISNCMKHGFPQGRTGEVRVTLMPMEDRQCRLSVSDNGVGLPTDFESRRNDSLGLQLVTDLAQQLGARLVIGPGPGASFTVIFTSQIRSYPS